MASSSDCSVRTVAMLGNESRSIRPRIRKAAPLSAVYYFVQCCRYSSSTVP